MVRSARPFVTALALAVSVIVTAAVTDTSKLAWAQSADEISYDDPELKAPLTNDPRERAKEFYARGRKNYDLGRFNRAIALFTRAYEETPDAAFLFNIGQSYRQLGNCDKSLDAYSRFLAEKKDVPPKIRTDVEGHIEACSPSATVAHGANQPPPANDASPAAGATTDDSAAAPPPTSRCPAARAAVAPAETPVREPPAPLRRSACSCSRSSRDAGARARSSPLRLRIRRLASAALAQRRR